VKIINLTGHKLISGYPEGRRMWLNIKWYDNFNNVVREDGKYGPLAVNLKGTYTNINTLLNPDNPNTKVYAAHYGMTQEWANQLIALGYSPSLPLEYDHVTAAVSYTLGQLAAQSPGTSHETLHFVLNNTIIKDNRIPPFGFSYDEAKQRNTHPVPATQYGAPTTGGTYNYFDEVQLNPPINGAHATIALMYQPTSWELIQFLYLANNRTDVFLADQGNNLLDAWLNTGMAAPFTMASATWTASGIVVGTPPPNPPGPETQQIP
jgi:hypothetical protein